MVGAIVITIVATAGMASTTYVQFLKGGLLIVFSLVLVIAVCYRGFTTQPDQGGKVPFQRVSRPWPRPRPTVGLALDDPAWQVAASAGGEGPPTSPSCSSDGRETWWQVGSRRRGRRVTLQETQFVTPSGRRQQAGQRRAGLEGEQACPGRQHRSDLRGKTRTEAATGSLGPLEFLAAHRRHSSRVSAVEEGRRSTTMAAR